MPKYIVDSAWNRTIINTRDIHDDVRNSDGFPAVLSDNIFAAFFTSFTAFNRVWLPIRQHVQQNNFKE